MKIALALLSVILFFVPMLNAKEFANFSIDVPEDWATAEENNTYTFTAPLEQCSINVTIAPNQGASYNELAILLYQSMQGKTAKGDDDGFSFFVDTKSDVISAVRFTYTKDNLVFVVASGACNDFQDIVKSLNVIDGVARPYPILAPEQNIVSP